jgi:hypothetical protein
MLIATWRAQNWPLQAMGFAEWEALAAMAMESPEGRGQRKRNFPSSITAEREGERLVLNKC